MIATNARYGFPVTKRLTAPRIKLKYEWRYELTSDWVWGFNVGSVIFEHMINCDLTRLLQLYPATPAGSRQAPLATWIKDTLSLKIAKEVVDNHPIAQLMYHIILSASVVDYDSLT